RRALVPAQRRRRATLAWRTGSQRMRSSPWLVFALPALIFAPVSFQHAHFEQRQAQHFLEILWQVVAASLRLSVALIAFAFEAFMTSGQREYGGTLRDFAHDTQLSAVLYLGIAAIVTLGAVVFGWGNQAPGGWAAFVAALLALGTFAGLAYVFGQVTSALDPR